jgi:hypothetical protein
MRISYLKALMLCCLFIVTGTANATAIATLEYTDLSVRVSGLPLATQFVLDPFNTHEPTIFVEYRGLAFSFADAAYAPASVIRNLDGSFGFAPGDSNQFLFAGYTSPLDPKVHQSMATAQVSSRRMALFSGITLNESIDVSLELTGLLAATSFIDPTLYATRERIGQSGYLSYLASRRGDHVSLGETFGGLCPETRIFSCGALGNVSKVLADTRAFSLSPGTWDLHVWFDRSQGVSTTNIPEPAPWALVALAIAFLLAVPRRVRLLGNRDGARL